jgi:hypothetical protein
MTMSKQWWKKLSIRSIEQGAESLAAGLRAVQAGGAAAPPASPTLVNNKADTSSDTGDNTWKYVAIGAGVLVVILMIAHSSR